MTPTAFQRRDHKIRIWTSKIFVSQFGEEVENASEGPRSDVAIPVGLVEVKALLETEKRPMFCG